MPSVRAPLDPRVSVWHFLAFYMRFMRERAGLSLAQCGEIMGAARSTVSNLEAGRRRPQDDQMRLLDKHYGTGLLFQLILWFARMAHDPDWARQCMEYEKQSLAIKTYHGKAIPRPFQTEDYIRAMLQTEATKDIEDEVAARVERQRVILERAEPPTLWMLVDEGVLACPVGGSKVMKQQLEHLLNVASQPHVIMRIVPAAAGAHHGFDGPFQVISLPERDVAYAGAQNGGRLIESPIEARDFSTKFERIGAKALPEEASLALVKQHLEQYS
ncbi:transcriptional regulator with XRE-family HTH domain [Actinomadura coerulea]|uniref:Transcriptional regulator with XRE-family HTH domain n=1 Tax=Actinomadura coerulea TaxID=46159 RepID=A0A7X0FU86_9ACTN|nr:helix-turn-helix transcriptional regulator [Actinomadura coerulea]MBB6393789.1 transcriptional regulator with XRE-family HTH domain [Actinomadura coerulea]GGP90246.1 transcriptional regulator [Actinomadura coerulea]